MRVCQLFDLWLNFLFINNLIIFSVIM
jgi:hypothetical protein